MQPDAPYFKHSIFVVARDETMLVRKIQFESLNFEYSRGVQAGDAFVVFFEDDPNKVKKIFNLFGKREPVIQDLPSMKD